MTPPPLPDLISSPRRGRRIQFLIVLALCAVLVAAYFGGEKLLGNRLSVDNASGQPIEWLEITVNERTIRFDDLSAGETDSAAFVAERDGSFTVRGELADGTKIGATVGYVTNGMQAERVRFLVKPGGAVELELR